MRSKFILVAAAGRKNQTQLLTKEMNDDEWLRVLPLDSRLQTDNQLKLKETWSPLSNLE